MRNVILCIRLDSNVPSLISDFNIQIQLMSSINSEKPTFEAKASPKNKPQFGRKHDRAPPQQRNDEHKPRRDQNRPHQPPADEPWRHCMPAFKTYFKPFLNACKEHFLTNFVNNANYQSLNIGNVADIVGVRAEYLLPGTVEIKYTVHLELKRGTRGVPQNIGAYFVNVEILGLAENQNDDQTETQAEEQNPQ